MKYRRGARGSRRLRPGENDPDKVRRRVAALPSDVGRIGPDGYLTLTDRAKDVIKSGGEWISSVELENTLIGHPAIYEAAVVAVPDDKWQERPSPWSWFTVEPRSTSTDCARFVGQGRQVVDPERWSFVSEIPRTSVGKYDKKAIRARHSRRRVSDRNVLRNQTH